MAKKQPSKSNAAGKKGKPNARTLRSQLVKLDKELAQTIAHRAELAKQLAEAKTIVDGVMDTDTENDSNASDKMSRIIELTNESSKKVKNLAKSEYKT